MFKTRLLKCSVCETIVEVLAECGLGVDCCGRTMVPLADQAMGIEADPHAPRIAWGRNTLRVSLPQRRHPMGTNHFIRWIEVATRNATYRQFLKPGSAADVTFNVSAGRVVVRTFCSLHGLWKSPTLQHGAPAARHDETILCAG